MTIDTERHGYIAQLYADATQPTRRSHEERVAALLLALDLLETPLPLKPRYFKFVGKTIVTVQFSSEALGLQADVQALIERLNAQ